MTDRWYSEIELQKAYKLSPKESFCVIGAKNGLTYKEIADSQDMSVNSVSTLLQRARDKMKKTEKKVICEVLRGDNALMRDAVKNNDMTVLFKFVEKVVGKPGRMGKIGFYTPKMEKDQPGDVRWLLDNVFRYVDINGTTGGRDTEERAERIYQKYLESDPPKNVVGTAIIMYYAERYGLKFDIYEEME